MVLPALRADFRLYESYASHSPSPLTCGISAFGGETDRTVSHAALDAWRHQTVGRFELQMFPGGHFFVNTSRDDVLREVSVTLSDIMHA